MNAEVIETIRTIFDTSNARGWYRTHRRTEIDRRHVPLGWLSIFWREELHFLIETGEVEIVELPPRVVGRPGKASFLVKM